MRNSILITGIIALVWGALALLFLPVSAPQGAETVPSIPTPPPETVTGETGQGSAEAEVEAQGSFDEGWALPVLTDSGVVRMDLETYLTGVLLAEMPTSFAEEALKAQAVACRTYTLRSCGHRRHEAAAVCTDSRCCQGWRDPAEADPADRARAEKAVRETDGLAIYYGDELIDATFFSCSGGRTEDARAVWGGDLPYLRAVESPGEEGAAHYSDEVRVPLEEFREKLTALDGAVCFPEALGAWVGSVSYTPGGGVDRIEIGGRSFSGTQLRKAFGLRSTVFTLELTGEEARFTTRGNGHRVGMSQYGAEAMAENGADFRAILTWYYQGVEVRVVNPRL